MVQSSPSLVPACLVLAMYCRKTSSLVLDRHRRVTQLLSVARTVQRRHSTSVTATHSWVKELNPSQREATLRPRNSITRVIAGPGAGKTKVLTSRIAHLLIEDPATHWKNREGVLAVTFTKKAASEMERRLSDLLASTDVEEDGDVYDESSGGGHNSQLLRGATLGTFHSICSKILRNFGHDVSKLPSVRHSLKIGAVQSGDGDESIIDGTFSILDQSDQLRMLKNILKEQNIVLKSDSGHPGSDIRPVTILNALSLLNTRDAESHAMEDVMKKMSKKVYRIANEVLPKYKFAKYSENSLDFDDLILLTWELLLNHQDVREQLHRRYRHILVDEFQDTSKVQLDLVRLLTTSSLFVVGDGDQSIYSWRGACPESMDTFESSFHNRRHGWEGLLGDEINNLAVSGEPLRVHTVYLMENYRSTSNIVKAAQRVIGEEGEQETERQEMKPMRGSGPSPRVLACKNGKAEASFVVKTINSMVEAGDLSQSSTVALVYRTNAQSRLLEEACVEYNLRYVIRGSSGAFYRRQEVQDCMAYLRLFYNPRDRNAWARCIKAPTKGIGPASLKEFFSYYDAIKEHYMEEGRTSPPSPMDALMSLVEGNTNSTPDPSQFMSTRSINRFVPFASDMRALIAKGFLEDTSTFLLSIVDDLKLNSHFDAISSTKDEYEDRLANVMELAKASERYKDDGPCLTDDGLNTPLASFIDDVALISELEPDKESESDGRLTANLMTIHASKGLEFDAVFLVGNEDGTIPTQKAIGQGEDSVELAEERRLCYVAMTRARTHLVMTWRREVSYFAGQSFKYRDAVRSRFLDRIVSKRENKKKRAQPSKQSSQVHQRPKSGGRLRPRAKESQSSAIKRRNLHSRSSVDWSMWEPSGKKIHMKTSNPTIKASTQSSNKPMKKSDTPKRLRKRTGGQSNEFETRLSRVRDKEKIGISTRVPEPPPQLDSTTFFPVGSPVSHRFHGRGTVLEPPMGDAEFSKKMRVRVEFNGVEWDMGMDQISHIY